MRSGSSSRLLLSCRRLLLLRTRYNYSRTPPTHHAAAHETAVRPRARPLAPVAWAMRTTAAKASPPLLLLLLLLLPRPPLLLLPLPRLLLLLRMLSAHACKARRGQSHVNVPPSPPTKAPADHCEVWKVAMHAGGGHAGSMKKIGKHRTVRVAYRWRCRCPRAQLHIHVHGGADHMIRRRCRRR